MYSSVALNTVSFTSPELFHLPKLKLYVKEKLPLPPPTPATCSFCLCEFEHSRCLVSVDSYGICPSVTGSFHLVLRVLPRCSTRQNFIPFESCIILCCMDRPRFVYRFVHQWRLDGTTRVQHAARAVAHACGSPP